MRKFAPLLVTAALVLVGAGCTSTSTTAVNTNIPPAPSAPSTPAAVTGRAVFMVTDAASSTGSVTAVKVTVDKLEAHSVAQGWVTVSTTAKTFDLLQLKETDSAALLADANLPVGAYDQIRLNISDVQVTASNTIQTAKLPSSTLKIVGNLTVTAGQTATAEIDFKVDKSLHLTGSGKYILAPVVRLTTKSDASVKIDADEKAEVNGGATNTDETEGMDEKGEMKADFELKDKLDIDVGGQVKIRSEE